MTREFLSKLLHVFHVVVRSVPSLFVFQSMRNENDRKKRKSRKDSHSLFLRRVDSLRIVGIITFHPSCLGGWVKDPSKDRIDFVFFGWNGIGRKNRHRISIIQARWNSRGIQSLTSPSKELFLLRTPTRFVPIGKPSVMMSPLWFRTTK